MLCLLLVACGPDGEKIASSEAKETDGNMTAAVESYTVDTDNSVIGWEGTKLVGEGHKGSIKIQSGQLTMADGKIVGGKFTIDMATIANSDLNAEEGAKLVGHLQSADFFDVATYPTAEFEITEVLPASENNSAGNYKVTGNLKMKDATRSITIPVTVSTEPKLVKATSPAFVINRTEWGVKYGSQSSIANLAKDNVINDNIGLQLYLVASK